jgi:hypothetical protein
LVFWNVDCVPFTGTGPATDSPGGTRGSGCPGRGTASGSPDGVRLLLFCSLASLRACVMAARSCLCASAWIAGGKKSPALAFLKKGIFAVCAEGFGLVAWDFSSEVFLRMITAPGARLAPPLARPNPPAWHTALDWPVPPSPPSHLSASLPLPHHAHLSAPFHPEHPGHPGEVYH